MKKRISIAITLCLICTIIGACGKSAPAAEDSKEESAIESEISTAEDSEDSGSSADANESQLDESAEEAEANEPDEVIEFKDYVTGLLEKQLSIEDAEDVMKAKELYENLSEENRAYIDQDWLTKLELVRSRFDAKIMNVYDYDILAKIEQFNMFKAHENVMSIKDYANETETELLCRADEVIQYACYPKTLIVSLPYVSAYNSSALITSTVEETDEYALYTYVYNNNASKDQSKLDGNGYDDGFCQYIENSFTTTEATDDERSYAQKLKENLPDGIAPGNSYSVWLEETGDFIGYGKMSSTIARNINGIDVGRDTQYRSYETMSILIIYGDYNLEFMPDPQVSAFSETEETTEETEEITIEDFKNNHATAENAKPSTTGEENALKMAQNYLQAISFSHDGLVEQLEYEGFSHEEAVFGADNCGADWNEQAAKKAGEYLELMPFSKEQLIDQLVYDGFTQDEAEYGANQAY